MSLRTYFIISGIAAVWLAGSLYMMFRAETEYHGLWMLSAFLHLLNTVGFFMQGVLQRKKLRKPDVDYKYWYDADQYVDSILNQLGIKTMEDIEK